MRIGAVVEGLGERKALPSLVAKTALAFNTQAFVVSVVECGNWSALKKANGLEKYGRLLLGECDCDHILYVVDLDDGCVKEAFETIKDRADQFSCVIGKPVSIILMNREYETLFLQDLKGIKARSPEVEWIEGPEVVDAYGFRDAKGAFGRHLRFSYRPSIDQDRFTKKLDIMTVIPLSRALRKLAKSVTGRPYDQMAEPPA